MSNAEFIENKRCPHCKKIIVIDYEQIDKDFYTADGGCFVLKVSKLTNKK